MRSRSALARANDTAARHVQQHGPAPAVCPWCTSPLNIAGFCPSGCAREAVNAGDCQECGEPFKTGRPRPVLCDRCERGDHAQHVAGYRGAGFQQRHDTYAQGFRRRRDEER